MEPDSFATQLASDAPPERFEPLLHILTSQHRHCVADQRVWRIGSIAVRRLSASTMVIARRKTYMAPDDADHWVLSCCASAAVRVRTGMDDLVVPPGVPFLWSMAEWCMEDASESESRHADQVQIHLPRVAFRAIAPQYEGAGGRVLDTPLGCLLGDFALSLERRLPDLAAAELPRLAHTVLGLVGVCVAPSGGRVVVARSQVELGRLERVRQAVRAHLASPALGAKMLCRLVGMSRSNLYRLLETEGGVARYIQRQRLLEAGEQLRDTANRCAISAIAESLCFTSAAGFSRAFRREFGCTPSDMRSAAEASLAPCPVPGSRPVSSPVLSKVPQGGELHPRF